MELQKIDQLSQAFRRAKARRVAWEPLWRDCYGFALPQRGHGLGAEFAPAARHADRLFDGTATDAVEQLAASLLAELLPPWSGWFGLRPGPDVPEADRGAAAERLEEIAARVQGHFDRSNFCVEIHQCFLDLATIGTAHLLLQETPPGSASAFRFTALPAAEICLEGDQNGQVRGHFRQSGLTLAGLRARFPDAVLPPRMEAEAAEQPDRSFEVVEAVHPEGQGFRYVAFLPGDAALCPLAEGWFDTAPFITFRWLKGAGELYGRSPVMSALPDIKTANKVVELILKNASIAVTGIWLADDDGVLNPANIRLVPGSIIPKAVGSAGLTPLQAPGRFDVSELVLDDLRGRIRHTLLADRLGPVSGPRMTATEVLERSAQTARLLGAVYGRLQAELLLPLVQRALGVLARRGDIPPIRVDGRTVEIDYRSPLARAQAREDVQNTLLWLDWVAKLGPEAAGTLDSRAAALWLGRTLGVPGELMRHDEGLPQALDPAWLLQAAAND
ncbi:portal protein [Geminicoccaceae bacterium 1502E]|nr:portal protein [Geminicoccaceae bacterium 1502E]